jgi:hypothetical protein
MSCWVFIIIVCLFFVGSLSFAQGPDSRPSGWDKGEKRGWDSDEPRGLEKNRQKHKDKWDSMTDEEKEAKKEKRQEHKDKWDSMTDEEKEAKKEKRQKRFWEVWKKR